RPDDPAGDRLSPRLAQGRRAGHRRPRDDAPRARRLRPEPEPRAVADHRRGRSSMPVTPLLPQIEQFLHDNPQGVMTSFRKNGMPQLSIVTVYPRDGGVGVSITENRMKFKNL